MSDIVAPRYYSLAGLRIRSEIELWCCPAVAGPVDVSISLGAVPELHPSPTACGPCWEGDESGMLLTLEGHGRVWLKDGREVTIDLLPGGSMGNIRAFFMATVFGVLCHQRGMLPLHAGSIAIGGQVVLIAGDSGSGKSTVTAALEQRGLAVLSDDISVIRLPASGRPMVPAYAPYIRLWEDALRALGREPTEYDFELPEFRRYRVQAASRLPAPTLPLGAIYLLREARLPSEEGFTELTVTAALGGLSHNIFRRQVKITMGQQRQIFAWCSRLLREVPVFSFSRVRDLSQLRVSTERLHRHAQRVLSSAVNPA